MKHFSNFTVATIFLSYLQVDQDKTNPSHEKEGEFKDTVNVVCEDVNRDAVASEHSTPEHIAKKQKCGVCITCIGLLQWGTSSDAVQMVSAVEVLFMWYGTYW